MSSNIPSIDSKEYRIENEKNLLNELIHSQRLKTVTDVLDSVIETNSLVERILNVVETITSNEKTFLINQNELVMAIASLKKRQNQEYYDIRRYLLLTFMIVIPLFSFFKK